MAKLYGVHEIELRPGADPAQFEEVAQQMMKIPGPNGWTVHLLKGDRGERKSKYLIIYEISSVQERDRYFLSDDGTLSAEGEQVFAPFASVMDEFSKLATPADGTENIFTDYIEIAASA